MLKDLLLTTGCFTIIALVAVTLGQRLLRLLKWKGQFGQTLALGYLLGFAAIINGVVILGILHLFYLWIVLAGFGGLITWLHRDILTLLQTSWRQRASWKVNWFLKFILLH